MRTSRGFPTAAGRSSTGRSNWQVQWLLLQYQTDRESSNIRTQLNDVFFSDSGVFTIILRSSGEDPYLGFVLIQPVVKGIQSQGVIANAKHYIDNNQEGLAGAGDRHTTSEIVDERTQMEMYYPPFGTRIQPTSSGFHRSLLLLAN